jgi:hypothetical protein
MHLLAIIVAIVAVHHVNAIKEESFEVSKGVNLVSIDVEP